MDSHGNAYRDFFSQAGSSSTAHNFPAFPDAGDEDDFGPFSQPAAPSLTAPRTWMEDLDLNSQAEGFPHLGSYQEFLHAEQVPSDQGLPPRGPGGRSGRGGGRGVGRGSRSLTIGAGSGSDRGGCRGGGRGGGHGSTFARHSYAPPEHLGAIEDEDDNGTEHSSQSVRSKTMISFCSDVPFVAVFQHVLRCSSR